MLCGWRITRMRRTRKKESSDFFSFFFHSLFFCFVTTTKPQTHYFVNFCPHCPLKMIWNPPRSLMWSGLDCPLVVEWEKCRSRVVKQRGPTHSALLWLTADLTPPTSQSTPAQHWCVSIHQSLKRTHSPPHTRKEISSVMDFMEFFFFLRKLQMFFLLCERKGVICKPRDWSF